MAQGQPIRWNIFARELENILRTHKWPLGYLDDRGIVLQREKVRRLQRSLISPSHFPILNPEELDRLITFLGLTEGEQNRLHAAIVATAVERTLMDRIPPDIALTAADEVFQLCLATMQRQPDLALAAGVKGSSAVYDWYSSDDGRFDEVLDSLDEGTFSLFAAQSATPPHVAANNARKALRAFAHAQALLHQIGAPAPDQPEHETWLAWYSEADSGYKMATTLLADDTSSASPNQDKEITDPS